MHDFALPLLSALACALCNGWAAILQKISADKEKKVYSLSVGLLMRLFQDLPYVGGVLLDMAGWLFTLYAVTFLPLFFVQAIIASSIAVTALIERVFMHRRLSWRAYVAIGVILVGIVLLALAATPERAEPAGWLLKLAIAVSPLPFALLGFLAARGRFRRSPLILAVLGGITFGTTSIVGRILVIPRPVWHIFADPLLYGLIGSGILGIWLFSIALQRTHATLANAATTASQFIFPAIIGIVFLGDDIQHGYLYAAAFGTVLTLIGLGALGQE